MTTKKQRRANVAAKRAVYDEETKRMGLEALGKDQQYRKQKLEEASRKLLARENKSAIKKVKEATLPDNLAISYANSQAIDFPKMDRPSDDTPIVPSTAEEQLLYDIFADQS